MWVHLPALRRHGGKSLLNSSSQASSVSPKEFRMYLRFVCECILSLILIASISASLFSAWGREVSKAGVAAQTQPNSQAKPSLWIVPQTHWEGAVFKTREEYLEIGLPHILTVLSLLRKY